MKSSQDNNTARIFTARGKSMHPAIQEGWKVETEPVKAGDVAPGDIIVFNGQDKLICHRLIGKFKWRNKFYLINRGDSENIGKVLEEKDLRGKVVAVLDIDNKKIEGDVWKRPLKPKLVNYIYLPFFLIKRAFLGKTHNRFSRWVRKSFWKLYYPKN